MRWPSTVGSTRRDRCRGAGAAAGVRRAGSRNEGRAAERISRRASGYRDEPRRARYRADALGVLSPCLCGRRFSVPARIAAGPAATGIAEARDGDGRGGDRLHHRLVRRRPHSRRSCRRRDAGPRRVGAFLRRGAGFRPADDRAQPRRGRAGRRDRHRRRAGGDGSRQPRRGRGRGALHRAVHRAAARAGAEPVCDARPVL